MSALRRHSVHPQPRPARTGLAALALAALCGCDDTAGGKASATDALAPAADVSPADAATPGDARPPTPDAGDPGDAGPSPDAASDAETPVDAVGGSADAGVPDPYRQCMGEAKALLHDARPRDAHVAFEACRALRPGDADATFGSALSMAIDTAELAGMLLSLPAQIGAFKASRNATLAQRLHGELRGLRDELVAALALADEVDPAALALTVEAAPLYLDAKPLLIYRGRFDAGDLHLFRASVSMMVGLLDILATQDLRGDLFGLVDQVSGGGLSLDPMGVAALLMHLLTTEGGHFLELDPEDGAAIFADARVRLAAVGAELVAAVEAMRAEAPTDTPQVSVLDTTRGDARLVVSNAAEVDAEGTIFERPYELDLTPEVLAALEHTSQSIAGASPDAPVDFQTEFAAVLSAVLHPAARLGLLEAFLGALPVQLGGLSRRGLEAVLRQLLPLPAALDFGAFFDAGPVGLRFILPETRMDAGVARLDAEWECPDDLSALGLPSAGRGFLCGDAALLSDTAHFADTPPGMAAYPADGLALRGPYLRFADPTLHGLLRVDLSALGAAGFGPPGFRVPTAAETSTAFAVGLAPLFALLGAGN